MDSSGAPTFAMHMQSAPGQGTAEMAQKISGVRTTRCCQAAAASALLALAACAGPAPVGRTGLLGVGTPGVEAYTGANEPTTLQELVNRCQQVPKPINATIPRQSLEAACDQLHRTMYNQPGNTVQLDPPS